MSDSKRTDGKHDPAQTPKPRKRQFGKRNRIPKRASLEQVAAYLKFLEISSGKTPK